MPMSTRQALGVLGLSAGTSADEIRARFRRLARQTHPDLGGTGDLAQLTAARDVALSSATTCQACHGSGRKTVTRGFRAETLACAACGGTGKVS